MTEHYHQKNCQSTSSTEVGSADCTCTVSVNTLHFNPKGDTRYLHIPTDTIYILRQLSNSKLEKTKYLWNKDTEKEYFDIIPSEWKEHTPLSEREIMDVQAALIELLEHIHDGDRLEILYSLDNLTEHLRYGGILPIIRKDTAPPDNIQTVYLVPTHKDL